MLRDFWLPTIHHWQRLFRGGGSDSRACIQEVAESATPQHGMVPDALCVAVLRRWNSRVSHAAL